MKKNKKIKSDPFIVADIKHISDGELTRNSPASLKRQFVTEIYPPSKFEFLGIENGKMVRLRKRYHDVRDKAGRFA